MKTVLERAREEAFVGREQAAAYLAQVKACVAEGYNDEEDVSFAAGCLDEAQATLDAIDAAIAAGTPATTEVNIDLGDGRSVTLNASATDLGKLTEVFSKKRRLRIPFVADTSEDAIAAPAKDTKPLRIPIELDTSALVEELEGAIAYLKSAKPGFATGGIATGKAPFGVVGEQPGETLLFSGYVDRKTVADEVDKKEWSVFGATATTVDEPFFDLGDCVRVDTKGNGPVSGMSAIGIVVEIGTTGARRTYRVDFPYGFGLEDTFFMSADLTRIKRPDWL